MKKILLLFTLIALNGYADTQNPIQQTSIISSHKFALEIQQLQSKLTLQSQSIENFQNQVRESIKYQELRDVVLASRESSIDWWLTAISVFLALLGVFLALFGVFGFLMTSNKIKEFEKLNQTAEEELKKIQRHEKQAREDAKKISEATHTSLYKLETERNVKEVADEVAQLGTKLQKKILEARILQNNNKIAESITLWKEIIVISKYEGDNESLSFGYFNLGYLYNKLGEDKNIKLSIKAYQKAIEIKPDKHEAYYNMGNAYGELGEYQKAINAYQKAIEIKLDMHEAYNNMGNAYNELKEYQKAINACQKAIEIKPDNHEAYYNMGNAYNKLKEYQKAINAYQKTIEIKPDKHEAYYNMGNAYGKLGEYQKAINAYKKAIEIKPDMHEAYYNMGNAYGKLGEYQKEINAYQKAIEIKPDNHGAYYNMGNAYGELKEYQKAINAYQKASAILPSLIDYAKKQNFDLLESYINNLDDSPVKQQNLLILNQLKGHD